MDQAPTINIQNITVPSFMYGTAWKEDDTQRCVHDALTAGFRAVDTANQRKHYYEAGVGSALLQAYDEGLVKREDIFLQTKFTHIDGQDQRLPYDPQASMTEQVQQSFSSSLEHLHTNYLDSYVLHGPSQRVGLADQDWEVWEAMESLHAAGKTKLLGVSNVGLDQIKQFVEKGSIKPGFVQNRCYANTGWDRGVRTYCLEQGIQYQGFSLLTANRPIFENSWFRTLVATKQATPAQIVFSFAAKVGMLPLTGTTDKSHMVEDLKSFQVNLTNEESDQLEAILL
jgi:diketogulonate reductase-like aldo/keto reductase